MKIEVRITNQYGVERVFPVCDKAKEFSKIAGTATLTLAAIKSIKTLGYEVIVIQEVRAL
jgi:hypothetical protein